jgi:predicted glycoside hydrolase/deacetylase ChbG (UPF0249 family)
VKRLIVNADDFGWSPEVNRGIIDAHRDGIVTSTTLITDFPGFEEAVALAPETPTLGVGLHLNLVHGRPVSHPELIPTLVTTDGNFRGMASVVRRALTGRLDREDVERELHAQLARFREQLGEPTHLDCHKHVYVLEPIRTIAIDITASLEHPRMRCPHETGPLPSSLRGLKCRALRQQAGATKAGLQIAGGRAPDNFVGIAHAGHVDLAVFQDALDTMADGVTEIMCHPGYFVPGAIAPVPMKVCPPESRQVELDALRDPSLRERIERHGIELINYGAL